MGNLTPKGKIVIKYLETFTEWPSLTLAKKIAKENPMDFKGPEDARSIIRYMRAASGERLSKKLKDRRFEGTGKYTIPREDTTDFLPVKLPVACNNIGILSDLHIPNHRSKPITIAYDYFLEQKINTIIINGDVADNTPFTRHDGKRPSASDVRDWFNQIEYFFETLRDAFPTQAIYWTEGNHDHWYVRWMNQHAWQLDDDPYFSLQERLHIDEYKIKFIPQQHYVLAGKLAICHGHQLAGKFGVGVAPARNIYNKIKNSMLISHIHKSDTYSESNLKNELFTCYTTGCLCTLTPEYQPFGGKANHGFAHVQVKKGGDYLVNNLRITGDKLF